jgi:alkanesulfonate monooxygenase SsuD/methylene tetrahydromethanopterin reductase-like flavin-dependent oxidoreductase (luciferase family)
MTFGLVGPNEAALARAADKAATIVGRGQLDGKALRLAANERGMIAGSTDEVVDHLGRLAEMGVSEVQFEHLDFDDDSIPEYLASEIAPQVKNL